MKLGTHVFWIDRKGQTMRGRVVNVEAGVAAIWTPGVRPEGEMRFPPAELIAENSLDARVKAATYDARAGV